MASINVRKNVIPLLIAVTVVIVTFILFSEFEGSVSNLLNGVIEYPATYVLVSFLVLAADIVLPVPSSVVMYLNGYVLGFAAGSIVSLLSLLLSSIIGYYIGRLASVGSKPKSAENVNVILAKYGMLSILMTRGIPILSESICVVCGYNKVPFKQYFVFNLMGYVPLCLIYAVCGSLGYDEHVFFISFGCSILVSLSFWFLGKNYFRNQSSSY